MFTYPSLLGRRRRVLKDCAGCACKGSVVKKAIYVISLVLLGGALAAVSLHIF
jgi:hypothetical protein